MKIGFVTSNEHKFKEVNSILSEKGIELELLASYSYIEDKEKDIESLVKDGLNQLENQIQTPFIIEDTFLFFKAYNHFPGAFPKYIFNSLGFKGILKLLEEENREAYFKTVIGYKEPQGEMKLFEGIMEGEILEEPVDIEKEGMDYDYIFQPKDSDKPVIRMSLEEKNNISQRGQAVRKLANYLINKNI